VITISPSFFSAPQQDLGPAVVDASADQTKNFFSLLLALFPPGAQPQVVPTSPGAESALSTESLPAQATSSLVGFFDDALMPKPTGFGKEDGDGQAAPAEQNLLFSLLLPFLGGQTPTAPTLAPLTSGETGSNQSIVPATSQEVAEALASPGMIAEVPDAGLTAQERAVSDALPLDPALATSETAPKSPALAAAQQPSPLANSETAAEAAVQNAQVMDGSLPRPTRSVADKVETLPQRSADQVVDPMKTSPVVSADPSDEKIKQGALPVGQGVGAPASAPMTPKNGKAAVAPARSTTSTTLVPGERERPDVRPVAGATGRAPTSESPLRGQANADANAAPAVQPFDLDGLSKGKNASTTRSLERPTIGTEALPVNRADGFSLASVQAQAGSPVRAGENLESWRSVVNQVSTRIGETVVQEGREARLQLEPPELGKLDIQLVVKGAQVRAHILAESADVGAMIQTHLPELKQALQSHRLDLDTVRVDVQSENLGRDASSQNQQQEAQTRRQGGRFGSTLQAEDAPVDAPTIPPIEGRGRVSVWA
jgi:flagellar hook-length control protein FliK